MSVNSNMPIEVDKSTEKNEKESLNLRDFLVLCLHHWKWFVLSLVVCCGIGLYECFTTPSEFERTAEVLIMDEDNSTGGMTDMLAEMGFGGAKSNARNELMAFKSPALMKQVIDRLGLRTSYSVKPRFRDVAIYGDSLPVIVDFLDLKDNEDAEFILALKGNGKAEIQGLQNKQKIKAAPIAVTIPGTYNTPMGRVKIEFGPAYSKTDTRQVKVTKGAIMDVINSYVRKSKITLPDDKAAVIEIALRDENPQRAEDVVNTLIACYNDNWAANQSQSAIASSNFMDARLQSLEQELSLADNDITQYQRDHLTPDLEASTKAAMMANQENDRLLLDLNTQLAISRDIANKLSDKFATNQLLPANTGLKSESLSSMINEYNGLQMQRDNYGSRSGENNPVVADLERNLESMRQALLSTFNNHIASLRTEIADVMSNDAKATGKVAAVPEQAQQLLSFERQRGVKQDLYLFLLKKREENDLSQAYTNLNTRILSPAMGEENPVAPNKIFIMMASFLLGLLIPAIILYMMQSVDTKVRTREDLQATRVPYLGEIPIAAKLRKGVFKRLFARKSKFIPGATSDEAIPQLIVRDRGHDIINESFRTLRTSVEFMIAKVQGCPVIMTTSLLPGSGKTFITLNLASALALKHNNSRVLLLDLDLRRSSLSEIVNQPPRGMADYLAGSIDNLDVVIQPTDITGLYVLPVGTLPPNPSELLSSETFTTAISQLKSQFDYIIIDCPPCELITDALIVTGHCDLSLFVIRAGRLDKRQLKRVDSMYQERKLNNMVLVLNETKTDVKPYRSSSYISKD